MTWGGLDCHRSRSARRAERGRLSRRHPISPDGAEHRHRPQNSLLSPTPSSTASADTGGMPDNCGQPLPNRQPQAPRPLRYRAARSCCLRNPSARDCAHCARLLPSSLALSSGHDHNLLSQYYGQAYAFSELCYWCKALEICPGRSSLRCRRNRRAGSGMNWTGRIRGRAGSKLRQAYPAGRVP